jgi:hypothetical protein
MAEIIASARGWLHAKEEIRYGKPQRDKFES